MVRVKIRIGRLTIGPYIYSCVVSVYGGTGYIVLVLFPDPFRWVSIMIMRGGNETNIVHECAVCIH